MKEGKKDMKRRGISIIVAILIMISVLINTPLASGSVVNVNYVINRDRFPSGDMLEIYSYTREDTGNGSIHFSISYRVTTGYKMSVFVPPDGDDLKIFGPETTGSVQDYQFDVPSSLAEEIVIQFFTQNDKERVLIWQPKVTDTIETNPREKKENEFITDGSPVGPVKEVLLEKEDRIFKSDKDAISCSCTEQELDNGCVRYTVLYTVPMEYKLVVRATPDASLLSLYDKERTGNTQEFQFDVEKSVIEQSESIFFNFYKAGNDRLFYVINLKPEIEIIDPVLPLSVSPGERLKFTVEKPKNAAHFWLVAYVVLPVSNSSEKPGLSNDGWSANVVPLVDTGKYIDDETYAVDVLLKDNIANGEFVTVKLSTRKYNHPIEYQKIWQIPIEKKTKPTPTPTPTRTPAPTSTPKQTSTSIPAPTPTAESQMDIPFSEVTIDGIEYTLDNVNNTAAVTGGEEGMKKVVIPAENIEENL